MADIVRAQSAFRYNKAQETYASWVRAARAFRDELSTAPIPRHIHRILHSPFAHLDVTPIGDSRCARGTKQCASCVLLGECTRSVNAAVPLRVDWTWRCCSRRLRSAVSRAALGDYETATKLALTRAHPVMRGDLLRLVMSYVDPTAAMTPDVCRGLMVTELCRRVDAAAAALPPKPAKPAGGVKRKAPVADPENAASGNAAAPPPPPRRLPSAYVWTNPFHYGKGAACYRGNHLPRCAPARPGAPCRCRLLEVEVEDARSASGTTVVAHRFAAGDVGEAFADIEETSIWARFSEQTAYFPGCSTPARDVLRLILSYEPAPGDWVPRRLRCVCVAQPPPEWTPFASFVGATGGDAKTYAVTNVLGTCHFGVSGDEFERAGAALARCVVGGEPVFDLTVSVTSRERCARVPYDGPSSTAYDDVLRSSAFWEGRFVQLVHTFRLPPVEVTLHVNVTDPFRRSFVCSGCRQLPAVDFPVRLPKSPRTAIMCEHDTEEMRDALRIIEVEVAEERVGLAIGGSIQQEHDFKLLKEILREHYTVTILRRCGSSLAWREAPNDAILRRAGIVDAASAWLAVDAPTHLTPTARRRRALELVRNAHDWEELRGRYVGEAYRRKRVGAKDPYLAVPGLVSGEATMHTFLALCKKMPDGSLRWI
jgi:hypothetical protein